VHSGDKKCIKNGWKAWRKETTWKTRGHRWEDNITIDLTDMGFGGMDWIQTHTVKHID
jgi:hypothetical protein